MSKLRTALSLVATGNVALLRRQLLIGLRQLALRRHSHPFIYQLCGFPFVCDPADFESTALYLGRQTDHEELRLIRTWLRPGDTCIDIGANLGVYLAAAAHAVGPSGACLGIEAAPSTAARLGATLTLLDLPRVRLETVAVGDSAKEIILHQARPGIPTGEQSLRPALSQLADYTPVPVRQDTLSAIVSSHPEFSRPALIKIDIEGAEPAALSAAPAAWFTPEGPLWIAELNPAALARFGSDCAALAALFPASAFHRILIPQYPLATRFTPPPRLLTSVEIFTDALYYNLVALPLAHPRSKALLATLVP